MSLDTVRAKAIALLEAGAVQTPAFERLAEEYGRLKARGEGTGVTEPKTITKGGSMKTNKRVLKGANGKEVRRSGFGRGAASNWDAFGTIAKTKGLRLEDGVYQVKGGELRRMADTNGTGTVCVVYRVAAKAKDVPPAKATKPAKKEVKASDKAKAQPAKATKKAEAQPAPAKKGDKKPDKKAVEKKADKKVKKGKK